MHILHKLAMMLLGIIGLFALLGWYLAPQDRLRPADAIVTVSGDDGERLKTAITLKQEGWAPLLIFSGAAHDPSSPSNAATMRHAAILAGIDPNLIIIEEGSRNTRENAERTARIIDERRIESIILVTSPYHQRRAAHEFRQALGGDVDIINHSAQDHNWRRSRWWNNPRGWYLTVTETPKLIYAWLR
jgi:uncharacterized SAM-binding protein YcdF (DUF218 family)